MMEEDNLSNVNVVEKNKDKGKGKRFKENKEKKYKNEKKQKDQNNKKLEKDQRKEEKRKIKEEKKTEKKIKKEEKKVKQQENKTKNKDKNKIKKEKHKKEGNHRIEKENKDKENIENKEVKKDKENKKIKKEKKIISKKAKIIIITIILLLIIIAVSIALFLILRPKFKEAKIELGTKEISVDNFLVSSMYKENSKLLTPLEQIDFSKVSDIDIKLSYRDKEETVKLHIVDTTAPTVKFQDITKYAGYVVNADDFIVEKSDLSEMTVEATNLDDTNEYKDYIVTVTVKDKYGNVTSRDCILTITWIRDVVYKELGQEFTKADVIVNMDKDADKLPQSEVDKVDMSTLGEYVLIANLDGVDYTTRVIVQDTTPPALELKNITIYDDETVSGKDAFIVSATDASGEVTTNMKTEIDYSKIGEQQIVIEAIDKNNNRIEQTAILTIKKDTEGPVFSGLSNMTVAKNSSVNYTKGVKATDAREGACEFTVNSDSVKIGQAGTYYATYTSKDSKGNTTTKKRKITVKHNQEDTNNKFNEFYANYLQGKNVYEITATIKNKIGYNHSWGDDDPVWYGLTNGTGNCYVHALILQKALNKEGFKNMLIHTTDKSHYWNLVYADGVWRHYDSTPGSHSTGPLTDIEKLNSTGMNGRTWDRSSYPAAE